MGNSYGAESFQLTTDCVNSNQIGLLLLWVMFLYPNGMVHRRQLHKQNIIWNTTALSLNKRQKIEEMYMWVCSCPFEAQYF